MLGHVDKAKQEGGPMISTKDPEHWTELLKIFGNTKTEATSPNCSQCGDLGNYEVFTFKSRPHPITGYHNVNRIMKEEGKSDWQQTEEHVVHRERCRLCFTQFASKHESLVARIEASKHMAETLEAKGELLKLWGRFK